MNRIIDGVESKKKPKRMGKGEQALISDDAEVGLKAKCQMLASQNEERERERERVEGGLEPRS